MHEAFYVFDIGGDGVVSLGEFVRVLKRMEPPLPPEYADRQKIFSMYTALDRSGKRQVKLADFVSFFLRLYKQRLAQLTDLLRKCKERVLAIDQALADERARHAREVAALAASASVAEAEAMERANATDAAVPLRKRANSDAKEKEEKEDRRGSHVAQASAGKSLEVELRAARDARAEVELRDVQRRHGRLRRWSLFL